MFPKQISPRSGVITLITWQQVAVSKLLVLCQLDGHAGYEAALVTQIGAVLLSVSFQNVLVARHEVTLITTMKSHLD